MPLVDNWIKEEKLGERVYRDHKDTPHPHRSPSLNARTREQQVENAPKLEGIDDLLGAGEWIRDNPLMPNC
jgi:hypothetical protein